MRGNPPCGGVQSRGRAQDAAQDRTAQPSSEKAHRRFLELVEVGLAIGPESRQQRPT